MGSLEGRRTGGFSVKSWSKSDKTNREKKVNKGRGVSHVETLEQKGATVDV